MKVANNTTIAGGSLAVLFIGLTAGFLLDLWGRPGRPATIPPVDPAFTNTATVRMSAGELIRSGGDASGLDCNACHEKGKQVKIQYDDEGHVVLPKEHEDLVMRHGARNRNDSCFNCHDPENLAMLKTADGHRYGWEESTKLCASCHGPTFRDWEAGVHGRTSGSWDRSKGPITRAECASCHHPHAPTFPSLKPAPGPHLLHPQASAGKDRGH